MKLDLTINLSIDKIAEQELKKITKDVKSDVLLNTPIKKWKLRNSVQISNIEEWVEWISQTVYTSLSDVKYAKIVEDWVQWKTYNYNLWNRTISWVWAKMYETTFKQYQKTLWNIIK